MTSPRPPAAWGPQSTCARQVEAADESRTPTVACGRLATTWIAPTQYGRSAWPACDEHAAEAIAAGCEVDE